jgi:hypothetical protein
MEKHGHTVTQLSACVNPLNAELNPNCHLLALEGAHHILHVSRINVKATHDVHFYVLVFITLIVYF